MFTNHFKILWRNLRKRPFFALINTFGHTMGIAVVRIVVNNPKHFFADETTGNLDNYNNNERIGLLSKLNSQETTVIMITCKKSSRE